MKKQFHIPGQVAALIVCLLSFSSCKYSQDTVSYAGVDSLRAELVWLTDRFDNYMDTTDIKLIRFDQQTDYQYVGMTNLFHHKMENNTERLRELLLTCNKLRPQDRDSIIWLDRRIDSLEAEINELQFETRHFFKTTDHSWWWR